MLPRIRFGAFEPLIELAGGGMATVFVARHVGAAGFERLVVLKRVHPHLVEDAMFHDSLRDEARIASLVRHPNVVSVTDVVELEGELILVMEYVDSASLHTMGTPASAKVGLTPAVVTRILADVLAGLHAAHEAKDMRGEWLEVVHRDVSPHNVIVGVDGVARLIDFGIAKAAVNLAQTAHGNLKGKFAYMSPEQALGTAIDRRSDLFAVGTVLFETLTGRPLFSATQGIEALQRVINMKVPNPSAINDSVPLALDAVVRRALARGPGDRFQSAQEFQEALLRAQRPAAAREVAASLEKIAGPRLLARRLRLRAILDGTTEPRLQSTRGAFSPALPPLDPSARGGAAPQRPTPPGDVRTPADGLAESGATPPQASARGGDLDAGSDHAEGGTPAAVSRVEDGPSRPPRRAGWRALAVTLMALGVFAVGWLTLRDGSSMREPAAPAKAPASAAPDDTEADTQPLARAEPAPRPAPQSADAATALPLTNDRPQPSRRPVRHPPRAPPGRDLQPSPY